MVNIRAEANELRNDFEGSLSHLIEVYPYQISTKSNPTKPNPVKVSAVMISWRGKTEVELRYHTWQKFRDLSSDQKDEPTYWQGSN